ncbi:hypothetical protein BB560_004428, partial [Smittium megazygosporum]
LNNRRQRVHVKRLRVSFTADIAKIMLELFSTDIPPMSRIHLIGPDYTTQSCRCKIKNVACLGCGNEIGYHITQPCAQCLKSCNNGHFWMFLTESVMAFEYKETKYKFPDFRLRDIFYEDYEDYNEFGDRNLLCR